MQIKTNYQQHTHNKDSILYCNITLGKLDICLGRRLDRFTILRIHSYTLNNINTIYRIHIVLRDPVVLVDPRPLIPIFSELDALLAV